MSRKGNIIQITVNDDEREAMERAAEKSSMPRATFIRWATLQWIKEHGND